jgi:CDP-diacylglycerol pyrophosphatase
LARKYSGMRMESSRSDGLLGVIARLALALCLLVLAAPPAARAQLGEPFSVLWPLVQNCVANQQTIADPRPCFFADSARGYAFIKDLRGTTQILLVATDRRWGIEDPRVQAADAPNYFAAAWAARRCVLTLAGGAVPESELSLAINSTHGRSVGQLHIHIDRLRPDVAAKLAPGVHEIAVGAHRYGVRHIDALAGTNLFAAEAARAAGVMGDETIVVAGDPHGGFYVLTDRAGAGDAASGEELQVDHPKLTPQQMEALPLAGCAQAP